MATAIMVCSCKHSFQDKKYGRKRRVFNSKADRKVNLWTCTVCGKDKSGTAAMLRANGNGEEDK